VATNLRSTRGSFGAQRRRNTAPSRNYGQNCDEQAHFSPSPPPLEQEENRMAVIHGSEINGPSVGRNTRKSRPKRSPTGQTRAAEQPPITTGLHHHGVAWSGGRGHQHHPTRESRQQADVRTLLAHQRVGANMAESGHRRGHDSSAKQSSSPSARAGVTRHAHGAEFKRGEGARAQHCSTGTNWTH
jgi:hypothetical protein